MPLAEVQAVLERLKRKGAKAAELLPAYKNPEHADLWKAEPGLYRAFARRLVSQGHPTLAFELAREGLAAHPGDQDLTYRMALAMARGGNTDAAEKLARPLLATADIPMRIEATSLMGRLEKDRFARARDPGQKARHASASADWYFQASALPGAGSFPAINAATMCQLAGDAERAQKLAREAVQRARQEQDQGDRSLWPDASLGEAHVILRDLGQAAEHYRKAIAIAQGQNEYGDIASMRGNALLLRDRLDICADFLRTFYVGSVVAFAGHTIDRPGQAVRFPNDRQLVLGVASAIRAGLKDLNATIGVCSASCGADLLFAEAALGMGAEVHVVLPYDKEDFRRTNVDFGLAGDVWGAWQHRFEAVLAQASEIHYATKEAYLGDDALVEFGSRFTTGLATIRAGQRGVALQAMVVADPASPVVPGGALDQRRRWESMGVPCIDIDLARIRAEVLGPDPSPVAADSTMAQDDGRERREIKSILFADVKSYSALDDKVLPSFVRRFRETVRAVAARVKPEAINTWGDAIYLVFDSAGDCAEAALVLLEEWALLDLTDVKQGKASELSVRIGAHAGPVFPTDDDGTGRPGFYGSQVTRAARIEPKTIPGCAFVSEQLAALLAIEAPERFACDYIGVEELEKKFDRCALYRLGRR